MRRAALAVTSYVRARYTAYAQTSRRGAVRDVLQAGRAEGGCRKGRGRVRRDVGALGRGAAIAPLVCELQATFLQPADKTSATCR